MPLGRVVAYDLPPLGGWLLMIYLPLPFCRKKLIFSKKKPLMIYQKNEGGRL